MDAIVAEGISKVFHLQVNPSQSLKERLVRLRGNHTRDFTALQTMDLSVAGGETLGILGHNGSGKSTLLKCISGILKPTTGTIRIRGRIASLLELGAGFHPELTGRENVFINAAFLGISRAEIARRFDDIVDFAELHEFIDEPVKHYSSGMYVRLGFAVAINLDPDILLVDEVLAVGDEVFQQKCLDRVRQFQQEGRTIVVVTHAADVVRQVCQRAIVLHHGEKVADTRPGEAIRIFREHLQGALSEAAVPSPDAPVRIDDLEIHSSGQEAKTITSGDPLELTVVFTAQRRLERPVVHVSIISPQGQTLYAIDIDLSDHGIGALDGTHRITASFARIPLLDGRYMVSTRVFDQTASEVAAVRVGRDEFSVLNPGTAHGVVSLKLDSVTAD
ncbi:MAG: ABC transporter ATP-binding protein [Acidimicrobiaceae bacterium]|nr:ABC transporter ATP-binding protein [Acidimicrobiaceae bacterium]MCO5331664.1 ABC transporter ATP-binding protein [Ilumatobacteraceae bacterium]